nr:MAG TPA: hypothetical protein [Bacteriophage sp.]
MWLFFIIHHNIVFFKVNISSSFDLYSPFNCPF